MELTANAKINLGLEITERLPDGYHSLLSIFHEIPLCDRITLEKTEVPGITLTCSNETLSCGPENLCYKAAALVLAQMLPEESNGVVLHLEKNIPMQAGLGGGSSDAAAVLKGMKSLFGLSDLTDEDLTEMAESLGADVPFFLSGGCVLVKGKGEVVQALPALSGKYLVLAKPEAGTDTGRVYRRFDELETHPPVRAEKAAESLMRGDYHALCVNLGNALEAAACTFVPEIARIKEALHGLGADYAAMTGSGSTVFGLFEREETARAAAAALSDRFWTWEGKL